MSGDTGRHIVICGAGIIGLCCARDLRARGHTVTVVDRVPADRDGCSFGNAGMITPSHFVPLAAPGMVALGLKWMFDSSSPFYVQPRLDKDFLRWSWLFWRAGTRSRERGRQPARTAAHHQYVGLEENVDRACGFVNFFHGKVSHLQALLLPL